MDNNNPAANVDDLTSRLDQMNVETNLHQQHEEHMSKYFNNRLKNRDSSLELQFDGTREYSCGRTNTDHHYDTNTSHNHYQQQNAQQQDQQMSVDEENIQPLMGDNSNIRGGCLCQDNDQVCTLIVTKLDPTVFSDKLMKAKFESLFLAYDEQVTFRYLKSFRRVRLDFTSSKRADMARINLNNYKLGTTTFKCYLAQIIRPNFANSKQFSPDTDIDSRNYQQQQRVNDGDGDDDDNYNQNDVAASGYLKIPKQTRQHLISPPMSPPVGWEPKEESSPCIDVQLLSLIANLVPGQTHEIHAGNESQPGIFVEVCEDAHFDMISKLSCRAKPKTMIPATPRPVSERPATGPTGGQSEDDCYQMQS